MTYLVPELFSQCVLHLTPSFPTTGESDTLIREMLVEAIPPEPWLPSYPDVAVVEARLAELVERREERAARRRRDKPVSAAEAWRAAAGLAPTSSRSSAVAGADDDEDEDAAGETSDGTWLSRHMEDDDDDEDDDEDDQAEETEVGDEEDESTAGRQRWKKHRGRAANANGGPRGRLQRVKRAGTAASGTVTSVRSAGRSAGYASEREHWHEHEDEEEESLPDVDIDAAIRIVDEAGHAINAGKAANSRSHSSRAAGSISDAVPTTLPQRAARAARASAAASAGGGVSRRPAPSAQEPRSRRATLETDDDDEVEYFGSGEEATSDEEEQDEVSSEEASEEEAAASDGDEAGSGSSSEGSESDEGSDADSSDEGSVDDEEEDEEEEEEDAQVGDEDTGEEEEDEEEQEEAAEVGRGTTLTRLQSRKRRSAFARGQSTRRALVHHGFDDDTGMLLDDDLSGPGAHPIAPRTSGRRAPGGGSGGDTDVDAAAPYYLRRVTPAAEASRSGSTASARAAAGSRTASAAGSRATGHKRPLGDDHADVAEARASKSARLQYEHTGKARAAVPSKRRALGLLSANSAMAGAAHAGGKARTAAIAPAADGPLRTLAVERAARARLAAARPVDAEHALVGRATRSAAGTSTPFFMLPM